MSWTRLESATVAPDLVEGLEARIADPLWLLARQWQTGEFRGDDAANPLVMEIEARSTRIDRLVLPGGRTVEPGGIDVPLEPLVEREPVRAGPAAARVAADLGRLLIRSLVRARAPRALLIELQARFPIELPEDDGLDPLGRRRLELLAAAGVDGARLAVALGDTEDVMRTIAGELEVGRSTRRRIAGAVARWLRTTQALFSEPERFTTWDPRRMEYRFALEARAPDDRTVRLSTGEGYAGGRLDWYAFDHAGRTRTAPTSHDPVARSAEVLPTPLRFRGMPAARFWELEEGDVYWGGIEAAPEDLARVAVAGYGVVYGDDWFLVPIRLPLGTLTQVTAVVVHDDFGATSTIPATAVVDGGTSERAFKFFELAGDDNPGRGRTPLLFLPPVVEATEAGRPLEDVRFVRDEMANVAWAVEQRIQSHTGRAVDLAARRRSASPRATGEAADAWRYLVATPVPDNWVPLIPVRIPDEAAAEASPGAIMLQRGRVPLPGDPSETRGALGAILEPNRHLLIHEEEIPRAGIRVVRRFQSARDAAGRLHVWVGRRKGPGRGEGQSGLRFDELERPRQGTESAEMAPGDVVVEPTHEAR